jgi:hypothetical protein
MNKDKLIWMGVIIIIVLVLFGIFSPPSRSGDVTVYQEREILLKNEIKRKAIEIRTLKSRDSVRSISYQKLQDFVKKMDEPVEVIRVVYKKATRATDLSPDSTNLLNEVRTSRKLIVAQEAHINALLGLNSEADKLISSKVGIIQAQEGSIQALSERFDNMVASKDLEIKKERKRGNRKFLRGIGIGAAIVAVLVII